MKKANFIIIILSFLFGCKSLSYEYEAWKKSGANEVEVKKALLECGAPSPFFTTFQSYMQGMNSRDVYVSVSLCMWDSGFHGRGRKFELCKNDSFKDSPACNGVVLKRDVNRRLNSKYCRYNKGQIPICRTPDGMSWEKGKDYCIRKETDPVPLECVP